MDNSLEVRPSIEDRSPLARIVNARNALAAARSLDEVKDILDLAIAAKRYAEAKKLGEESVGYAQEIVNRATRRMGEMLAAMPKHEGGRPAKTAPNVVAVSTPPTLKDLGITDNQSSRAQQLAKIPEPVFERAVTKPVNRLLRVAREAEAEQRRAEPTEPVTVTAAGTVDIRHGDFREILGDLSNVDAIITDPPYPGEFRPLFRDLSKFAAGALAPNGVLAVMCGQYYLPDYIALLSEHMAYRWCGAYITQGPRTRVHAPRVGTGWKPILLFQHRDAEPPFLLDDVFRSAGDDKDHHHWGQSESGMAALVERLTTPGALVVDPFLGGGTTAVVCRDLGRRFVGCDIDAAHVATSRERAG